MDKQVIVLTDAVDKKHSVCYKVRGNADAAITALYLMRTAFKPNKAPKAIRVTIEDVSNE
jgi:hypothetical protein